MPRQRFPRTHLSQPWHVVAPHLCPEGRDLLARLLAYDPSVRISAADALAHPYFRDVRVPLPLPPPPPPPQQLPVPAAYGAPHAYAPPPPQPHSYGVPPAGGAGQFQPSYPAALPQPFAVAAPR